MAETKTPPQGRKITLGLIQMPVAEDPAANIEKAKGLVRAAAGRGARIICLPELYRTRYFPQAEKQQVAHLAESVPGESTDSFCALAQELEAVLIVPIFERSSDGRLYNSAVILDADGRLLDTYRKIHLPQDPLFYEKSYFEPGNRGFRAHKTRYATVGALICYDQWFPEAARVTALKGADILFYPTAIGDIQGYAPPEGDWREAWITIQRAHAIANGVHVAAVNRVGAEGELRFWGSSFICDAFGQVVRRGGEGEEVVVAEVDLDRNRAVQEEWGFLRNRSPENYGALVGGGK